MCFEGERKNERKGESAAPIFARWRILILVLYPDIQCRTDLPTGKHRPNCQKNTDKFHGNLAIFRFKKR